MIELMIVLAIVGILAAIAYPTYTKYVRDAQRSGAKAELMATAQRLERCYTANNSYKLDTCSSVFDEHTTDTGYWSIKVDLSKYKNGQGYELIATKTNKGVVDPACSGKMTIDQRGDRQPTDECW